MISKGPSKSTDISTIEGGDPANEITATFDQSQDQTVDLDSSFDMEDDFLSPDKYLPKQFHDWGEAIWGSKRELREGLIRHVEESRESFKAAEKALIDFEGGVGLSLKERFLYAVPFLGSYLKEKKREDLADKAEIREMFYRNDESFLQSSEAGRAQRFQVGFSNAEFTCKKGDTHIHPIVHQLALPLEKKETLFSFNTLKGHIADVQDAGDGKLVIERQGDTTITFKNALNQTMLLQREMDGKVKVFISGREDGLQKVHFGSAWNDDALQIVKDFSKGILPGADLLNKHYDRMFIPSLDYYGHSEAHQALAWVPPWLRRKTAA